VSYLSFQCIPALHLPGIFDQTMADAFVSTHLMNKSEFWTPTPLPSIAASDPRFQNKDGNNWSGPPEGLTFQRVRLRFLLLLLRLIFGCLRVEAVGAQASCWLLPAHIAHHARLSLGRLRIGSL
jgi:hypothetical protein